MPRARTLLIAHWASRIVTGGILAMGVIPKFTGQAGELAAKLPGGDGAAIAIGAVELAAIVLMFVPRTTLVGSALAAVIMLGAIGSHLFGPVGMEGDFASMFIMAIIAFLGALGASALARARGVRLSGPTPKTA